MRLCSLGHCRDRRGARCESAPHFGLVLVSMTACMHGATQSLSTPLTGAGQQFFVGKIPQIIHEVVGMNCLNASMTAPLRHAEAAIGSADKRER